MGPEENYTNGLSFYNNNIKSCYCILSPNSRYDKLSIFDIIGHIDDNNNKKQILKLTSFGTKNWCLKF